MHIPTFPGMTALQAVDANNQQQMARLQLYANGSIFQRVSTDGGTNWAGGEVALKSDLGTPGNYKIVATDVNDLDNPPNAFILQTVANSSIPGFPSELLGNRVLVLQLLPGDSIYSTQLAFGIGSEKIALRRKYSGTWRSWAVIG